jgi:hypothetical protein
VEIKLSQQNLIAQKVPSIYVPYIRNFASSASVHGFDCQSFMDCRWALFVSEISGLLEMLRAVNWILFNRIYSIFGLWLVLDDVSNFQANSKKTVINPKK